MYIWYLKHFSTKQWNTNWDVYLYWELQSWSFHRFQIACFANRSVHYIVWKYQMLLSVFVQTCVKVVWIRPPLTSVVPWERLYLSIRFIKLQLERQNYDFFPMNRALCLQNEESDSNEIRLETMMSQVTYLVNKMKEQVSHNNARFMSAVYALISRLINKQVFIVYIYSKCWYGTVIQLYTTVLIIQGNTFR